jgi:hypothetical protein
MKFFLACCLLVSAFNRGIAQEDPLLQFSAMQIENRVQLSFTISAGNTCNGIIIYRSVDSLNFSEIGDIQGVCGSTDKDETYSFTDYSPGKNATNFYRLQMGTLGYSRSIALFFIELTGNKALVFPNPVTDESEIFFLNPSRDELRLKVFGRDLRLVYESEQSRMNSFRIDGNKFTPGLYFYTIENAGVYVYKGEFVVR